MARKSGKLGEILSVFDELDIKISDISTNDGFIYELIAGAKAIPDPRHPSYIRHLLEDIVMICLFAILADCDEWEEFADFAVEKEKWLRKYLELPNGAPSADTIRVVISSIDTRHFHQMVMNNLMRILDGIYQCLSQENPSKNILSMDGKESRGSKRNATDVAGKTALHALNLYSMDYGFCVGQEFIADKSNEIPAGPLLLERMNLKDCVVTWDALNTQVKTVAAVIKGKGDYVAALKENHPLFYQEVKEFFTKEELENLKASPINYKKTIEKEHGGAAVREYYLTAETEWYEDRKKWEKMNVIGVVKKTLIMKNGEQKKEERYYFSSLPVDIDLFENATRGHWGVENCLHWHLDFTFKDDRNTTTERNGAKNLQILKKISLSILRMVQTLYGQSLKRIRKTIARNCEKELDNILSAISKDAIKEAIYIKQV